jgi:hypothetical protein
LKRSSYALPPHAAETAASFSIVMPMSIDESASESE